jgi:hypothetical protein
MSTHNDPLWHINVNFVKAKWIICASSILLLWEAIGIHFPLCLRFVWSISLIGVLIHALSLDLILVCSVLRRSEDLC